jgi:hypothetical protein
LPVQFSRGDGPDAWVHLMAVYFFRISHGHNSDASDLPREFETREAAWTEMRTVCSNLVGGIARSLKPNAEWQMELLDEAKEPVFRIRMLGEALD